MCVSSQPDDFTNLGGFGDDLYRPATGARYILKDNGSIYFWGYDADVDSGVPMNTDMWQMLTTTYDGDNIKLYKNGIQIASEAKSFVDAAAKVKVASPTPVPLSWPPETYDFAGKIDEFTIWDSSLSQTQIDTLADTLPWLDGDPQGGYPT